jgi:hypothetical protein
MDIQCWFAGRSLEAEFSNNVPLGVPVPCLRRSDGLKRVKAVDYVASGWKLTVFKTPKLQLFEALTPRVPVAPCQFPHKQTDLNADLT